MFTPVLRLTAVLCLAFGVATAKIQGDDCSIYSLNQCDGDVITTDASFEKARWFTPARGSEGWQESFQDYDRLVGYAHVVYDADLASATVTINATHRDDSDLTYVFGEEESASNSMSFDAKTDDTLLVSVKGADGSVLEMEPVDFAWNAPSVTPQGGDELYRSGQKGSIVEFFGWSHSDILSECAFLADAGYMGAKFFPPQEQVMSNEPFNNDLNPWFVAMSYQATSQPQSTTTSSHQATTNPMSYRFFMYQPMSYKLGGRMGTRDEL
eukprot:CAMPEP_0119472790 /NCGR_PEP_ID=MMETSP1344-20130328/4708_1 /TAXON_ID=236787 /ORGANISM="Florenciella parvula, Strain CCMP2471" /LENGTH=267 /DNA_ID=CAMNT_0007505797 /DNA_START=31 /DNA_END=832 /DNA_ORIENTATION=-